MREEIASGMQEVGNSNDSKDGRLTWTSEAELVAEKETCEALEARVRQLENSPPMITVSVDKSQVVSEFRGLGWRGRRETCVGCVDAC